MSRGACGLTLGSVAVTDARHAASVPGSSDGRPVSVQPPCQLSVRLLCWAWVAVRAYHSQNHALEERVEVGDSV